MNKLDTSIDTAYLRPLSRPAPIADVHVPLAKTFISVALDVAPVTVGSLALTAGVIYVIPTVTVPVILAFIFGNLFYFTLRLAPAWRAHTTESMDTLYARELRDQQDHNNDGYIGRKPITHTTIVNAAHPVPISTIDPNLVAFVEDCFVTGKTGMDYWESQGMDRDEYIAYRNILSNNNKWDGGSYIERKGTGNKAGWKFYNNYPDAQSVIDALYGQVTRRSTSILDMEV